MAAILQMTFLDAYAQVKSSYVMIKNSPKFVPKGPINNISTLIQ